MYHFIIIAFLLNFQNGLVLIDSPGIGENDGMDTVIETFVDTNQVMGFIYIIKSDNGGGVDEDRVTYSIILFGSS